MNLTRFADYSLRVLIYVGIRDDQLSSIQEISEAYDISRNHLVKVVHQLGRLGYVETTRGRGGGLRLARPASEIRIGDVVRHTEGTFELLECFNPAIDRCAITPACGLKSLLGEAMDAFLGVLDRYTLADVIRNKNALRALLSRSQRDRRIGDDDGHP